MKWPIVTGAACTLLGFYLNNEIVPRGHEIRSRLRSVISVDVGLKLLEPGRIIDVFPGFKLFFKAKEGNWLVDLLIFDYTNEEVMREIRADKALVSADGADVVLDMYNVRVDPIEADRPGVAVADRFRHVIPDAMKPRKVIRKEKDMRFAELRQAIDDRRRNAGGWPREMRRKLLSIGRTEFHLRFVYACASLCFVMVGMPLGIRTHRKESTVGTAVSLVVAMSYYLCVILVHSLDYLAVLQPHALLWVPVAVCGALAVCLTAKNL
jgi:lipopolysaccharide export system permease protein